MENNSNKNAVLITGASSGIGEATAYYFAEQCKQSKNIQLILIARRKERLDAIASDLKEKYSLNVFTDTVDVRNLEQVNRFLKNPNIPINDINTVINNAGLALGRDSFQNCKIEDWEQMIDTNIKGLLYITKGVLPNFISKKTGHIINIGSIAGKQTYPNGAVYCASKAAVHTINEGLRLDLIGTGIRVTSINPGMVESEFSLVRFKGNQDAASAVYKNTRSLLPEDIARTIYWAYTQPTHVNIQEILIMPTDQASARDVYRAL